MSGELDIFEKKRFLLEVKKENQDPFYKLKNNKLMIYIGKTQKAVKFAIKTHEVYKGQKRKGKEDVSYISHPLTVSLILSRARASEDLIIAGILHDTIEDSIEEKKVTFEMVEERFGRKVADLVMSVSEKNKGLSWTERKKASLEHIKEFSQDSLFLKSADVISNTSEILDDYKKEGDKIFERFNSPEPKKENSLNNYIKVMETILDCWPENPLKEDLNFLIKELNLIKNE